MGEIDLQVLEADETHSRFILSGIDPAVANTLRRTIIADVPTMAIDEVAILENSSVLFDEILSHRLGFIPLKADLSPQTFHGESDRENSRSAQVALTLEVEAAGEPMTVFSGHLKSEDPKTVPVSDLIPIVKLGKGQRVVLEAFARLGKGSEHAKWIPVSTSSYKYIPKIKIDHEKCNKCWKCVQACPKRILVVSEGGVEVQHEVDCSLCMSCVESCDPEAVRATGDESKILFNITTTGSLSLKYVMMIALNILIMKCETFAERIEELS